MKIFYYLSRCKEMSKYYAVRAGKVPGIYRSWAECQKQVIGYKGAVYKSFATEFEAQDFIGVELLPSAVSREALRHVLYVDGGHNAQTGKDAWACVVNRKGKDILAKYKYLFTHEKMKDVVLPVGPRTVIVANYSDVTSQNNGAELLAMWAALLISVHEKRYQTICSDSSLIVDHWSKKINPAKQMCARKKALILEVIELRKEFEAQGGVIVKIPGAGNPADLGYH